MLFLFERRDAWLYRIDPISKFVWLLSVSALAVWLKPLTAQTVLLTAVLLVALFLGRIPLESIWRRSKYFIAMCACFFLIQLVFFVGGEVVLLHLGFFDIKLEGVDWAAASAIRIYVVMLSALVFVISTSPRELALALNQRLRVPYVICAMLSLGFRYFALVEESFQSIKQAHMVRGIGESRGIRGRFRDFKRYMVSLLSTMLERGRITAMAMDSRAFRTFPTRTHMDEIRIEKSGWVFSFLSVAASIAFLIVTWPSLATLGVVR